MFKNVNMLLEEDNIASLEENVSVLNTETTISDKKKQRKNLHLSIYHYPNQINSGTK